MPSLGQTTTEITTTSNSNKVPQLTEEKDWLFYTDPTKRLSSYGFSSLLNGHNPNNKTVVSASNTHTNLYANVCEQKMLKINKRIRCGRKKSVIKHTCDYLQMRRRK